jgi:hypothetical protein
MSAADDEKAMREFNKALKQVQEDARILRNLRPRPTVPPVSKSEAAVSFLMLLGLALLLVTLLWYIWGRGQ